MADEIVDRVVQCEPVVPQHQLPRLPAHPALELGSGDMTFEEALELRAADPAEYQSKAMISMIFLSE